MRVCRGSRIHAIAANNQASRRQEGMLARVSPGCDCPVKPRLRRCWLHGPASPLVITTVTVAKVIRKQGG
jgi:hypothetical protein